MTHGEVRGVLWVIAARQGSKGIPNKNIRPLGQTPLLVHRILSAKAVKHHSRVWISTDSEEYARIAASYGAEVPFIRPAHLASDEAKSPDVLMHAMEHANREGLEFDAIGLLEPTSPFVTAGTLDRALDELFADEEAHAVVATRKVSPSTFYIQKNTRYLGHIVANMRSEGIKRRQDEDVEITPSGGFYISKWDAMLKNRTYYTEKTLNFLVPENESLEIDTQKDWDWAEFLIGSQRVSLEQGVPHV